MQRNWLHVELVANTKLKRKNPLFNPGIVIFMRLLHQGFLSFFEILIFDRLMVFLGYFWGVFQVISVYQKATDHLMARYGHLRHDILLPLGIVLLTIIILHKTKYIMCFKGGQPLCRYSYIMRGSYSTSSDICLNSNNLDQYSQTQSQLMTRQGYCPRLKNV